MMQSEDPPFLTVGTEVSAKYKGAFCEAKVNKVVKVVKIKVNFKQGLGSAVLSDEDIKGVLKLGAVVKANHPDKNQFFDAIINKIQDCSQYTVVFDDGDITTLRRTSLCLKSGRHFAESETLDQLPLTHPEHFGTPVVGGRRGRRSRHNPCMYLSSLRHLSATIRDSDDSSDEDSDVQKRHRSRREEWEADIGKVVCVELGDKKKQKDNWFPGLVVAPTAQDTVKIETKKDYLVRPFQDGRYYTVPKKEASPFSKEIGSKVSQTSLRTAVDKAVQYLDSNELPPHWDRDLLFGVDVTDSESDPDASDSDSSDDEPREEKDHFVAQLYKFMEECGTPINKGPTVGSKDLDLYKLFKVVQKLGGFNRVVNQNQWKFVATKMNLQTLGSQAPSMIKSAYKRYLHNFEDFYRKLGCTMVSNPRGSRTRHKSGRSLIRDCDKAPRELLQGRKDDSSESNGEEGDRKEDNELQRETVRGRDGSSNERKTTDTENKIRVCKLERSLTPELDILPSSYDITSTTNTSAVTVVTVTSKERVRECRTPRSETKTKASTRQDTVAVVTEVKTRSAIKEEKKQEEDDDVSASDKEQEVEIAQTRSLRNREESSRKDESKDESSVTTKKTCTVSKKIKIDSSNERSASSSSNCSTSSVSTHGPVPIDSRCSTMKGKVKMKAQVSGHISHSSVNHSDNSDDGSTIKKRGRKKKLDPDAEHAGKDAIPAHVPVIPGDRLQVLYGPSPKESKVTYEAKVLEVKEECPGAFQYYVHYLGWNTRHDEWIPRSCIASNVTWSQNRAKKGRAAVTKEIKEKERKEKQDDKDKKKEDTEEKKDKVCSSSGTKTSLTPGGTKRGRSAGRERHESEKSDAGTVSTPGTRASSRSDRASQPESPVIDLRRSKRNATALSEEVSDSDEYESDDADTGSEKDRSRSELHGPSSISSSSPSTLTPEPPILSSSEDKVKDVKPDIASLIKCEPYDRKVLIKSDDSQQSQSCGKDIDLKAIESEMKGLDKPIKKEDEKNLPRIVSLMVPASLTMLDKKHTGTDVLIKRIGSESPLKKVEIQVKPVHTHDAAGKPIMSQKRESKGFDIYEFKEPEPFEFGEIRRKDMKMKSCGNLSEDGEQQEVVKVRKKGRPKKDSTKEDCDKSESDSDGSLSPQKRHSPSKDTRDTPVKKEELPEMTGLVTPEKKESSPGVVMITRKSTAKKDNFKPEVSVTPDLKNQKNVSSIDVTKTPVPKSTPTDSTKSPSPNRDHLKVSGSSGNRAKSTDRQLQTPSPQVRPITANIRLTPNQVRHQSPGTYQLSSTQIGTARFIGPVTYSGTGVCPNTSKPLSIRTKVPNPATYPGSAVQRNLSSSLNLVTTSTLTTAGNVNPSQVSPKSSLINMPPQQSAQVSPTEITTPASLPQPRMGQHLVTQISTTTAASYSSTATQQVRISPPNTIVHTFTTKPKLSVQTIQTIGVKPIVTYAQSVFSQAVSTVTYTQSTVIKPSPTLSSSVPLLHTQLVPVDNNIKASSVSSLHSGAIKMKQLDVSGSSENPQISLSNATTTVNTIPSQSNPIIHLLPQVVIQPKESKVLAKPLSKINVDNKTEKVSNSKIEDKNDGKVIPFSQRQQQIFPHLLNRPEPGEKLKDNTVKLIVPPMLSNPSSSSCSEELIVPEISNMPNPETERLLQEASVEESIEAVVQRAREDQSSNDASDIKSEGKSSDRKRRSSNRTKKVLSREFIPDTSEESDSDSKQSSNDSDKQVKKTKSSNNDGETSKFVKKMKLNTELEKKTYSRKAYDEPTDDDKDNTSSSESQSGYKDNKDDFSSSSESTVKREIDTSETDTKTAKKKMRSSQTPKSRIDEEVSNGLGDLLCEETIPPGSPMAQENVSNEGEGASRTNIKHEMPFASVPTGSNYSKRGTAEQPPLSTHGQFHQPKTNIAANIQQQAGTPFVNNDSNSSNSNNSNTDSSIIKSSNTQNKPGNKENDEHSNELQQIRVNLDTIKTPEGIKQAQSTTVIDNTPPTTPESIASPLSDSPSRRGEESGASKSCRDSSEAELDCLPDPHKGDQFSEDSNTMDSNVSGADPPPRGRGRPAGSKRPTTNIGDGDQWDGDEGNSTTATSTKRRKRGPKAKAHENEDEDHRKGHSNPPGRRRRRYSSTKAKEEDCDHSGLSALSIAACSAAGRSKYNFCQELDPDLDAEKRIHILQSRIQELKKTYMQVKAELASVERRRKKLRKKEREKEAKNEAS